MVGLARVAQGIVNGKPVIFLLLLLIIYVLVWIVLAQLPLIDEEVKLGYQSQDWGGYITAGALTFLLLDSSYSLGSNQTLQGVFGKPSKNSGGGEGGTGCSSGGDGGGGGCGGGCGGCGGCGGS